MPRYNPRILPQETGPGYYRLAGETTGARGATGAAPLLGLCFCRFLCSLVVFKFFYPTSLFIADEYRARQLALTGPLLGLKAAAAGGSDGDAPPLVHYFGPEPSLWDDDGEGGDDKPEPVASVTTWW